MNVLARASAFGASINLPIGNSSAIFYKIYFYAPDPYAIELNSILSMKSACINKETPICGNGASPSDMKYKTILSISSL